MSENSIISIEVGKEQFGEFISNLLGQRRSIELDANDKIFIVTEEWLRNLDLIIQQRVEGQHNGSLVSFSHKIFYSNGEIKTNYTRESFRGFIDYSQQRPVAVEIKYSYLIQFPGTSIPEKQDIRFYAAEDRWAILDQKFFRKSYSLFAEPPNSTIYYIISYTNFTWGDDISRAIKGTIDINFNQKAGYLTRLSRSASRSSITPMIFAFSTLIIANYIYPYFDSLHQRSAGIVAAIKSESALDDATLRIILDRVNLMILQRNELVSVPIIKVILYAMIVPAVVLMSAILLGRLSPKSAVLLNQYSKCQHDKIEKKEFFMSQPCLLRYFLE